MPIATSSSGSTPTSTSPTIDVPATVFGTYLTIALLAAGTDLVTKALANLVLRNGHTIPVSESFGFVLVRNTGIAGGASLGPMTWLLNVLVTLAAVLMVMRIVTPLSAVDPRATFALGLVSGGAIGNLTSMVTGSEGVTDFIALQISSLTTVVMNVADLFLWTGAILLIPVVVKLVGAVIAERAEKSDRVTA